jgi:hypothetical protein
MKKLFPGIMLFMATLLQAQFERNVGDFYSLKVFDRINVELISSDENKVEIPESNVSDVEIVNKNGDLKIRMITSKTMSGNDVEVKVYFKNLNKIQASQGSVVRSSQVLNASDLNLTSNEGSKINLQIAVNNLDARENSGGEINLTGNAENANIVLTSGAKFYGKDLESRNVSVSVNAGGNAEVAATNSVTVTTRAGGTVDVYGNPEHKNVKRVAGGKVNFF